MSGSPPAPHTSHSPTVVGKCIISPVTKAIGGGWYTALVAIRSDQGAEAPQRVLRLTRLFRTREAAASQALNEGLHWIGEPSRA